MAKKLRKSKHCLNCGHSIEDANYCPQCGQLNTDKKVSLKVFLSDFLGDYFTFDSKMFRSFIPLISKPGFLTNEYNTGRRANYILPLRLYIFTTFFFFLLITLNNKISDWRETETSKAEIIATADSLDTLIERIQPDLDGAKRKDLARHLYNNLDATYLNNENDENLIAELERKILQHQLLLDNRHSNLLAEELAFNFTFEHREKENKSKNILRLDNFLKNNLSTVDTLKVGNFISDLDTLYYIKYVKRKTGLGYITIFDSDSDSLSSPFELFLAEQVKKVARNGNEGMLNFLSEMLSQVPKALFLLLPIFALILKLFYIRRKILYINHLIFAVHIHTIFFIYLILPLYFSNGWVIFITLIALLIYVYKAFRKVYQQSRIKTFFKMNLIMSIYSIILIFAIILLLFVTLINV